METINISFVNYTFLPEDIRLELQELYMVAKVDPIDCQQWTWGRVKQAQDMLSGELTFQDIFKLAKMEAPKLTENSPADLVYRLFRSIQQPISEITKIEREQWSGEVTPKQQAAIDKVGGFAIFGTLPQTIRLTEILNLSYNEVLAIPWEVGFAAFTFDMRQKEYERLIVQ